MLQAPTQPNFFQKYSSFRKYLQYRKRPRKMPVKKFVLVQTFIKFKALQILPINKDCRFTNKYTNFLVFSKRQKELSRNVLQKSCYASVVEILKLYSNSTFSQIFFVLFGREYRTTTMENSILQDKFLLESLSMATSEMFSFFLRQVFFRALL